MLPGHFHAGFIRVHIAGNNEGGNFEGEQPVKDDAPLLRGDLPQIAHLHIAQHLQAHGLKVVKISRQLQPGPGDVLHRHTNGFIVTGPVSGGQLELLYQLGKRHAVGVDHDCHLIQNFTQTIIANCPWNINRILKNFGFFPFFPLNGKCQKSCHILSEVQHLFPGWSLQKFWFEMFLFPDYDIICR